MNDSLYWVDPFGTAHERCQLLFASTGELVGFDPGNHPELRWQRESAAYFCAYCGDIWERVILVDSRAKSRPFEVMTVACLRHGGGSVLAHQFRDLLPLLPQDILRREFELHIQQAERENDEFTGAAKTGTDGG